MSTKCSLWWSEDVHLYFDYADESEGPHAYLRIGGGLVKALEVLQTTRGFSITIRLPPEVFPVLRPDLSKAASEMGRPRKSSDWQSPLGLLRDNLRRAKGKSTKKGNPRRRVRVPR